MESYFNQAEIFHIIVDVDVELSYRTALIWSSKTTATHLIQVENSHLDRCTRVQFKTFSEMEETIRCLTCSTWMR